MNYDKDHNRTVSGVMRQAAHDLEGGTLNIAISDVNYIYKENRIRYMNYVESPNKNTRDSSPRRKPTWQVTIWIRSRASPSQRIFECCPKNLSRSCTACSVSLSAPKCSTTVATKRKCVGVRNPYSKSYSARPNSYKLNSPARRGVTRAIQSTRSPVLQCSLLSITPAARRSFHCVDSVSHSGRRTVVSKRHFIKSPITLEWKKSAQITQAVSGSSSVDLKNSRARWWES